MNANKELLNHNPLRSDHSIHLVPSSSHNNHANGAHPALSNHKIRFLMLPAALPRQYQSHVQRIKIMLDVRIGLVDKNAALLQMQKMRS
jgi:hypothetical protein